MRSSHAWAGTPATPLPCRYDARMYLGVPVFHVGGVVGTLNIGTGTRGNLTGTYLFASLKHIMGGGFRSGNVELNELLPSNRKGTLPEIVQSAAQSAPRMPHGKAGGRGEAWTLSLASDSSVSFYKLLLARDHAKPGTDSLLALALHTHGDNIPVDTVECAVQPLFKAMLAVRVRGWVGRGLPGMPINI